MARSLNKAILIGNLTRDPELRYTPQGTAVCTFGVATNRQWTTESGEKKEDVEFHRIVAWNKLAEICSQLLTKGRKVYVEGRLQTRSWTGQDGAQRSSTEIVITDMIILDSRREATTEEFDIPESLQPAEPEATPEVATEAPKTEEEEKAPKGKKSSKKKETSDKTPEESEDIPF